MGINDGFSKLLCPWEAESLLSFLPTHPYFFSMLWFHTCLITSYYIPSSPLISRWGEKSMRWRKGEKETKCHNHRNSLERQRERLKKYRAAHEWWQHRVSRPKGIAGGRHAITWQVIPGRGLSTHKVLNQGAWHLWGTARRPERPE